MLALAHHLAFAFPLVREFLTPLDLHIQLSEFGVCEFSQLLIRDAQRKRGSSVDHSESFSSRSPARLSSFLFVTREPFGIVLNCISLCILAFAPIGDVIFY